MMNNSSENNCHHRQRAAGAFFGRRKTKPLKRSQALLYDELLPRLKLDLTKPAPGPVPGDVGELFIGNPGRIILEIGFGGGEHLVQRAHEQPDDGFIGCEPFINGMGKALSAIDKQGLTNIRLYDHDATGLLDWLPAGSIDVVYLLYPDPWPKKRHWKRRFVNADNLQRICRILKAGGEFRFASDIAHYVNWTLRFCHDCENLEWQAVTSAGWTNPWQGWQSTRYENKGIREGRIPAYLTFKKR
jgi:tRNA (guanine-N7-)-methyltransferase